LKNAMSNKDQDGCMPLPLDKSEATGGWQIQTVLQLTSSTISTATRDSGEESRGEGTTSL